MGESAARLRPAARDSAASSARGSDARQREYVSRVGGESSDSDNHSVCKLQDGLLMRERRAERPSASWNSLSSLAMGQPAGERVARNEPLLGGFAILRAVQLLNLDVHYIKQPSTSARLPSEDPERADERRRSSASLRPAAAKTQEYATVLDELAKLNPLAARADRWHLLRALGRLLRVLLSLAAIVLSFSKLLATLLLCALSKIEALQSGAGSRRADSTDSASLALLVLVLTELSAMYILSALVFAGHRLWALLSRPLFLVSRRFQYRSMMLLLLFVYCEYFINLALVNNLFEFSSGAERCADCPQVGSHYALAGLRAFATDHHEADELADLLLTVVQFARGVVRISPYVTINYAIVCLREHISSIRNQRLLTDSLKRRQNLRLVDLGGRRPRQARAKKRVIFATEGSARPPLAPDSSAHSADSEPADQVNQRAATRSLAEGLREPLRVSVGNLLGAVSERGLSAAAAAADDDDFLGRVGDFDELESYITDLYIFTGRLNRLMGQQGLTVFFVVHNLTISCALIVPEAISGGLAVCYALRCLLIFMGILPFVLGQSLNAQLAQLSKQIDRIIIQQQFISRRRDNLVRIRELLHDIRVNCGGMLSFNVETGIKYLVVAFASAFFIEQEDYKLTRRQ